MLVLDARPSPRWRAEDMDARVYALSRASQQLFAHVGVWGRVAQARAAPYRRMRVWEGTDAYAPSALDFDSADIGEPDLGHIVEDTLLRTVLADALTASPQVQLVIGAEIESVEAELREIVVALKDGGSMRATVLLAADGTDSSVRRLLGLPVAGHRYAQSAVVTHVTSLGEHQDTAWQRFLPGGPLALLPLADGRSSTVWSLPTEEAERLLAGTDAEFLAELAVGKRGRHRRAHGVLEARRLPAAGVACAALHGAARCVARRRCAYGAPARGSRHELGTS